MQTYKCTVCSLPIGVADAGSKVHLACVEMEDYVEGLAELTEGANNETGT